METRPAWCSEVAAGGARTRRGQQGGRLWVAFGGRGEDRRDTHAPSSCHLTPWAASGLCQQEGHHQMQPSTLTSKPGAPVDLFPRALPRPRELTVVTLTALSQGHPEVRFQQGRPQEQGTPAPPGRRRRYHLADLPPGG